MTDSSWFSLKRFAVALGTVALGTAGGITLLPMLKVGSFLGMLLGGFAAGLAFEDRPLLESGAAGLLAGLGVILVSQLSGGGIIGALIGLVTLGPQILLLTGVLSFGLGALGAHFGNDFRDGLTQPVEE
jgi:hypothetical protein